MSGRGRRVRTRRALFRGLRLGSGFREVRALTGGGVRAQALFASESFRVCFVTAYDLKPKPYLDLPTTLL